MDFNYARQAGTEILGKAHALIMKGITGSEILGI